MFLFKREFLMEASRWSGEMSLVLLELALRRMEGKPLIVLAVLVEVEGVVLVRLIDAHLWRA